MVAVGEIVHGLELLVDDPDAGFMCADGDALDVSCRLPILDELGVDVFGRFDGGLAVEFGWSACENESRHEGGRLLDSPGYDTLNKTFSMT